MIKYMTYKTRKNSLAYLWDLLNTDMTSIPWKTE